MLRSDREKLIMKGFKTKVITLMVVAFSDLLLFQTSSVEAVDLIGYGQSSGCYGSALGCYNVAKDSCCSFSSTQYAVQAKGIASCQTARIYAGSGCSSFLSSSTQNICWSGFTNIIGTRWVVTCTTTTSATESSDVCGLPGGNSTTCKSTVLPNAVMYSVSGSSKGTWVLNTGSDKVHDTLAQLDNVPVDQKVAWLQNSGAHFDADPDEQNTIDGSHV